MSILKRNETNFTEGPYLSKIIRFVLPIMATGVLQIMFNAVDGMVVGKFVSDAALAAVTSTGSLITLIVNFFMGISIGSNVLVAQFYGAKRERDLEEVVHTSILISVILGIIVLLLGQFFSKTFLHWMNSPDDVIDLAALYLKIYFLGAPVSLLYNFAAAMLRAVGDTKHPLIFLTIGGVTNVFLNLFCVLVLKLGVEGVAIGTIASQFISAVLVMIFLFRGKGPIRVQFSKLKIRWRKLGLILKLGIPAGLQSIMFSISNVIVQTALNGFGKTVMAGNGAATQIESVTYTAMNSVYHASINFVGQNVGAQKMDRVKKGTWVCLGIVMVIGVVLSAITFLLGRQLLGLYTNSPESIAAGMKKILFVGLPYFISGLMDTMSGAVRGLGVSLTPMFVTTIGTCIFRVVWVMTVFRQYGTLESLYIVYPFSWTITFIGHAICFTIFFRRTKWKLKNLPKPKHLLGGKTTA